jgi:hypothetical protein
MGPNEIISYAHRSKELVLAVKNLRVNVEHVLTTKL